MLLLLTGSLPCSVGAPCQEKFMVHTKHLNFKRYEYNEAEVAALQAVQKSLQSYDKNIISMRFDEQTAALNLLAKEVRTIDLAPLANFQLLRWLELIEQENKAFEKVSEEWVKNSASYSEVEAASKTAPLLRKQLSNMVGMLEMYLSFSQEDEVAKRAYIELDKLGVSF